MGGSGPSYLLILYFSIQYPLLNTTVRAYYKDIGAKGMERARSLFTKSSQNYQIIVGMGPSKSRRLEDNKLISTLRFSFKLTIGYGL